MVGPIRADTTRMNITYAREALKKYFGYEAFRPMQADIIEHVYAKKDGLVLMPTGGGKSLCYQIPAVTLEGTAIVISPLISLMKDQVEALRANGISAAFLNSSIRGGEANKIEEDLYNGRLKLLYVSPERAVSRDFSAMLKRIKVSLVAIDEAHCVSAWGHDFRPEYTQLQFFKKSLPGVPLLALTATADKVTRRDIIQQLNLTEPKTFLASFDRPNINLTVRPGRKRIEQIIEFVKKRPNQPGIVYCFSRRNCEDVAGRLLARGVKATYYHAGLGPRERAQTQEDFINDKVPVVCATIAFGMGIDKSNVRWVIHYNLPQTMESYYQEIGRAGRDGTAAETILFYSYQDVANVKQIFERGDTANVELRLAKLDRMYRYATALVCRRKVLLSYFGEHLSEDCGNCDICKNPPRYFNGTVITQKALSAVARLGQRVGTNIVIDVLRGSQRRDVVQNGFHNIKTYGAGREHSYEQWRYFFEQLINLGLLEVAHDDHNKLRLTEASKAVLFDGSEVQLVSPETMKERRDAEKAADKSSRTRESKRQRVRDELFEQLRQQRLQLARAAGLPPYVVFTDKTLEEMAATRPTDKAALSQVNGVGEQKLRRYGDAFLETIRNYVAQKTGEGVRLKGGTYLLTLQLYKQGLRPEEIAAKRELNEVTVYSHLAHLYEKGEKIDLGRYVSKAEIKRVISVLEHEEPPYKAKDIFEALNEEVAYYKIRLALAWVARRRPFDSTN